MNQLFLVVMVENHLSHKAHLGNNLVRLIFRIFQSCKAHFSLNLARSLTKLTAWVQMLCFQKAVALQVALEKIPHL